MQISNDKKLFAGCSYTLFVNGIVILMIGSIMPFLNEEYNIGYHTAGSFLAIRFLGNILSGFLAGILIPFIGRKKTVVILSLCIGLSCFGIIMTGYVPFLTLLFFMLGIGTGSVNYVNTVLVNDMAAGKAAHLNILHTSFAVGAFLSPLIAALIIGLGFSWKIVIWTGIIFSASVFVVYCLMRITDHPKHTVVHNTMEQPVPFYKNITFYLAGGVLFFYLGAETSVIGWLVTYLKDAEIMSAAYAQTLLSIMWLVIIAGRLFCAYLATRIKKTLIILLNATGAALMFTLFLFSKDIIVLTIVMIVFGFFFAGIYPTTISAIGGILKGSNHAMATLMAIAGLGGIVSPYIVGVIASSAGITAGMSVIIVFNILTVTFALALKLRGGK